MSKFNVSVDGHAAEINLTEDQAGGFTGTVVTPEFGTGQITDGKRDGDALTGTVTLSGHEADFKATLQGTSISGTITYGWFIKKSFSGLAAA